MMADTSESLKRDTVNIEKFIVLAIIILLPFIVPIFRQLLFSCCYLNIFFLFFFLIKVRRHGKSVNSGAEKHMFGELLKIFEGESSTARDVPFDSLDSSPLPKIEFQYVVSETLWLLFP